MSTAIVYFYMNKVIIRLVSDCYGLLVKTKQQYLFTLGFEEDEPPTSSVSFTLLTFERHSSEKIIKKLIDNWDKGCVLTGNHKETAISSTYKERLD